MGPFLLNRLDASSMEDSKMTSIPSQESGAPSYELIQLGTQIYTIKTHRTAFGRDSKGKLFAYSTMIGNPAKLLVTDVQSGKLTAVIPVEDTVEGRLYSNTCVRGLAVQPDGTVYVAGTPSQLFKYEPGASHVQYICQLPGSQLFDMTNGPEGILIGGTYPQGEAFEFDVAKGCLTNLGPIVEGEAYVYSTAYDGERDEAYFGIGSRAYLIRYNRKTGLKTNMPLPGAFAESQFVFDMTIVDDRLFVRFSPRGLVAMNLESEEFESSSANAASRFTAIIRHWLRLLYGTIPSRVLRAHDEAVREASCVCWRRHKRLYVRRPGRSGISGLDTDWHYA